MKHVHTGLALTLGLAAAACGATPGDGGVDQGTLDAALGQSFGALTTDDEKPMFGEEDIFVELGEGEQDADDPSAEGDSTEEEVGGEIVSTLEGIDDEVEEAERGRAFAIRVIWGRKLIDGLPSEPTEWDPTITTTCGGLGLMKLIKFDEPQVHGDYGDRVVRPRVGPRSISFDSQTLPGQDGVGLILVLPPHQLGCVETGTVTVDSAALESPIVIAIVDLPNFSLRQDVNEHNAITIHATEVEARARCARGHMGGRWLRAMGVDGEPLEAGRFYGRAFNRMSELAGHLKGIWGVPQQGPYAGKKVFFAKIIDPEGTFVGIFAGRYDGDGHFGGAWHVTAEVKAVHGFAGGTYIVGDEENPEGGTFRGRYAAKSCVRPLQEEPLTE